LASPEARNKVLKNAKKLKSFPDSPWGKVFIHQDLTRRGRKTRRMLVQKLKAKRLAGEADLIIVNGKIVTERTHNY